MWNGLQDIVSAIAEEQSESRHSKQTAASLTESLRKAESERVEALKKCASLEDRLARYERPKDSKGRFCKKMPHPVAAAFTPPTVGLCGLEWMAEPLSGYSGTEVCGRTYYTQDEAIAAAKAIGHGWRLPTKEEFCALAAAGSTWIDKGPHGRPGRWFGDNHDTDHKGSLFLCEGYYRTSTTNPLYSHFIHAFVVDEEGVGIKTQVCDLQPLDIQLVRQAAFGE